jgi:hypothetical protein
MCTLLLQVWQHSGYIFPVTRLRLLFLLKYYTQEISEDVKRMVRHCTNRCHDSHRQAAGTQ